MLIIGDENEPGGHPPLVTWGLIATNVVMFLIQMAAGDDFTYGFSMIPREITQGVDLRESERLEFHERIESDGRGGTRLVRLDMPHTVIVPQAPGPVPIYLTLFTSMFMHGGILHLVMNMWILYIFGDNLERALGEVVYMLFYLLCGLVADAAQIMFNRDSVIPCLGASGAISGVMGGYILLHPLNRIRIFLWGVVELPALLVLGAWFLLQYLAGARTYGSSTGGGVAYGAHIGGFIAGLVLMGLLFAIPRRERTAVAPADRMSPQGGNPWEGKRHH